MYLAKTKKSASSVEKKVLSLTQRTIPSLKTKMKSTSYLSLSIKPLRRFETLRVCPR